MKVRLPPRCSRPGSSIHQVERISFAFVSPSCGDVSSPRSPGPGPQISWDKSPLPKPPISLPGNRQGAVAAGQASRIVLGIVGPTSSSGPPLTVSKSVSVVPSEPAFSRLRSVTRPSLRSPSHALQKLTPSPRASLRRSLGLSAAVPTAISGRYERVDRSQPWFGSDGPHPGALSGTRLWGAVFVLLRRNSCTTDANAFPNFRRALHRQAGAHSSAFGNVHP